MSGFCDNDMALEVVEHEEKEVEDERTVVTRGSKSSATLDEKLTKWDKSSESLLLGNSFLGDDGCAKVLDFVKGL